MPANQLRPLTNYQSSFKYRPMPSSTTPPPNSHTIEPSPTDSLLAGKQSTKLTPLLVLVAFAAGITCLMAMQFDRSLSTLLRDFDLPGDFQKAISLSETFAHGFGVFFILLSVFVIAYHRRRAVLIAILITTLSGLTANALKATVVRVRPHADGLQVIGHGEVQLDSADAVERSFWDARQRSFPSGHSATAWGLAIGLSLVFRRGWWIFAILATLACVQRLESGAHYPSDVLAGIAIAFLIAACVTASPTVRSQLMANTD